MSVTKTRIVDINSTNPSSIITVDAGAVVKIGLCHGAGVDPSPDVQFVITEITTDAPNYIGRMDKRTKSYLLDGPGEYLVTPPSVAGHGFGAYKVV